MKAICTFFSLVFTILTLSSSAMAACGGSTGGFLLFFNAESEKDIHRFKLPSLTRDMDWHPATERVLTVHHDKHLRVTNLFAKPA